MQTIVYNVHLPIVGERVTISNIPQEYTVYTIESASPPYDNILIKSLPDNTLSRLVIIKGSWQVEGYNTVHEVTFHGLSTSIPQQDSQPVERNFDDPNEIRVGDVGTYSVGGRYGRAYYRGFTVTRIISPGKQIEVVFDRPVTLSNEPTVSQGNATRILEYRRPGRWIFKGVQAKDFKDSGIRMGEKHTGAEEGIF